MHKRSAVLIASGLVLALLVASAGIMLGFTGPTRAGGSSIHMRARNRKPIVKTVTDRHTVHVTAPVVAEAAPQPAARGHHATTHHQQHRASGSSGGSQPGPKPSPKPSHEPDPSPTPTPQPTPTHTHESEPDDD